MKAIVKKTLLVTIANGTASGITKIPKVIDSTVERVIGISIQPISNGGLTYYRIGIQDDNQVYDELNHFKNYVAGDAAGLSSEQRFVATNIRGDENKVYVNVETPAPTTSDLVFDVTFLCERKELKK